MVKIMRRGRYIFRIYYKGDIYDAFPLTGKENKAEGRHSARFGDQSSFRAASQRIHIAGPSGFCVINTYRA